MHKYNFVLFAQTGKINLPEGTNTKDTYALALLSEIQQLGFYFDKKLFTKVKKLNKTQISDFKKWLIPCLQEAVGSHVRYVPLFKNFPEDVPEENEYLFLRITNFIENCFQVNEADGVKLSCGCRIREEYFDLDCFGACPVCQRQVSELMNKKFRKPLTEKTQLRAIGYLSDLEAYKVLQNLFSSQVSYSSAVKAQLPKVASLLQEEILKLIPGEIKNKENLASIWANVKKYTKLPVDKTSFKTATDVLRLAVALSGGDVSLKDKSNFKLSSSERKLVLSLIDQLSAPLEDMLRYRMSWLRLGEYLHVGAYTRQYPQAALFFRSLRNNETAIRASTFNSQAHKALLELKINNKSFSLMNILAQRPGEFARKLDFMVRESAQPQAVVQVFKGLVVQLNTVMLLKLNQYFKLRNEAFKFRYFIPKGNLAKIYYQEGDSRKVINQTYIAEICQAIETELLSRYALKKQIKSIYVDPKLKSMLVPLVQRNTSKNLETLYRGSRVNYNHKAQALRLFLYWKENEKTGSVDVDLSASGYDENWQYITNLSWTSLASMDCLHSGDIQSAPEGASEFIDINVQSMKENKIRYVVVNVFSWTGQKFQDFECFAGVMERAKTKSGEVYEPKTVKNKFDLVGDSSVNAPMILDLETNEIIWADISFNSSAGRRVENSTKQIAMMGKTLLAMNHQEPNLFDLFVLIAKSQGAKLYTQMPEKTPDLIITESEAKDVANILSNWI